MFTFKRLLGATLTAVTLIASHVPSANASVVFTFQRVSDQEAIMTATGTPDTGIGLGEFDNFLGLEFSQLLDGFGSFGGAVLWESGDFSFGNLRLNDAGDGFLVINKLMQAPPFTELLNDTAPVGSVVLRTSSDVFKWESIGQSGRVDSRFNPSNGVGAGPLQIGTWQIVAPTAVPEPASMALSLLALGCLGLTHRVRRMRR